MYIENPRGIIVCVCPFVGATMWLSSNRIRCDNSDRLSTLIVVVARPLLKKREEIYLFIYYFWRTKFSGLPNKFVGLRNERMPKQFVSFQFNGWTCQPVRTEASRDESG